jgi:hypothetical protein
MRDLGKLAPFESKCVFFCKGAAQAYSDLLKIHETPDTWSIPWYRILANALWVDRGHCTVQTGWDPFRLGPVGYRPMLSYPPPMSIVYGNWSFEDRRFVAMVYKESTHQMMFGISKDDQWVYRLYPFFKDHGFGIHCRSESFHNADLIQALRQSQGKIGSQPIFVIDEVDPMPGPQRWLN